MGAVVGSFWFRGRISLKDEYLRPMMRLQDLYNYHHGFNVPNYSGVWEELYDYDPKALPNLALWLGYRAKDQIPFRPAYMCREHSWDFKNKTFHVFQNGYFVFQCEVLMRPDVDAAHFFAENILRNIADRVHLCHLIDVSKYLSGKYSEDPEDPEDLPGVTKLLTDFPYTE